MLNAAAAAAIAATPITLSVYAGYGVPNREIPTTIGDVLGADHVAWICEQPAPAATAGSRARGAWDANMLEHLTAHTALERELKARDAVRKALSGLDSPCEARD